MTYEDHLGNTYETKKEMCDAYGIRTSTYIRRRKQGWGIRQSLTTPEKKRPEKVVDHKEKEYKTVKEMCRAYNVDTSTYNTRLKKGMTMQEALETPKGKEICDHLGNGYSCMYEMCKKYGITVGAYYGRLRKGMTKEEALTTPINGPRGSKMNNGADTKDHLGNSYNVVDEMCENYGISKNTYYQRLSRGWTKEDALTKPVKIRKNTKVEK